MNFTNCKLHLFSPCSKTFEHLLLEPLLLSGVSSEELSSKHPLESSDSTRMNLSLAAAVGVVVEVVKGSEGTIPGMGTGLGMPSTFPL